MSSSSLLRLDGRNVLRCAVPRRRGAGLECDTPIARPHGARLVIRCRNCHADHTFSAVGGRIVWDGAPCRLPDEAAVS